MASVAQVQANRSNAQKSTGPRTPEGKAAASRNAVKHGLLAEQVVIHGEDPEEFDLYREGMLAELAPVGAVEAMLAERAVSLAWRLRRAERLQSAVFATVYRENANDVVLWPKHGLPIQPGPDEEEVVLGQVVMTDFARAQVLDRLLVYERRIESSLYRTMGQLRREQEARAAVELGSFGVNVTTEGGAEGVASGGGCDARFVSRLRGGVSSSGGVGRASAPRSTPAATDTSFATATGNPAGGLEGVLCSEDSPPAGQEAATSAQLGSFDINVTTEGGAEGVADGGGCDARFGQRLRGGVSSSGGVGRASAPRATPAATDTSLATATVYPATAGNHGQDVHATETPDGVPTSPEAGNHGRDARATGTFHASPFTLHDPSYETNPIPAEGECDWSEDKCDRTG